MLDNYFFEVHLRHFLDLLKLALVSIYVRPFLFLAFIDLSSLRIHFWPFTKVLQEIRRDITRKVASPR